MKVSYLTIGDPANPQFGSNQDDKRNPVELPVLEEYMRGCPTPHKSWRHKREGTGRLGASIFHQTARLSFPVSVPSRNARVVI